MSKRTLNRRSTRELARKRSEQVRNADYGYLKLPEGAKMLKLDKEGVKRLDIIPYDIKTDGNPSADIGDLYFERTFWIHKNQGPDENENFICPKKTAGLPCPVCDLYKKMSKDADADKEEIKLHIPKERQLWNVIDLKDPEKIKIFDMSYHLFGKLLDKRIKGRDADEDFDAFAELQDGFTLKVDFEEKRFGKAIFYDAISIDFKNRADDYEDDIINEAFDLDSMFIILSEKEILEIMNGIERDSESKEKVAAVKVKEKTLGKKRRAKEIEVEQEEPRRSRKLKAIEAEEEEKEEKEAIEEVEKEKMPKRRRKPIPIEEIDETEPEEDIEEPKRRRKSREIIEKEAIEKESKHGKERKKVEKEEEEEEKCPQGYKFGYDASEYDECEECDLWNECDDKQVTLEKTDKL